MTDAVAGGLVSARGYCPVGRALGTTGSAARGAVSTRGAAAPREQEDSP